MIEFNGNSLEMSQFCLKFRCPSECLVNVVLFLLHHQLHKKKQDAREAWERLNVLLNNSLSFYFDMVHFIIGTITYNLNDYPAKQTRMYF